MKSCFRNACIGILCVALSCCLSSCENTKNDSYVVIQPPPEMPTFEIETFNFAEWKQDETYIITYSAWIAYNNHVGNSWGYGLTYNGKYIESGSYITVASMVRLSVEAFAIEYDELNDRGSAYVTLGSLEVGETQSQEVTVTIRENRGRYAGNTAQWVFEITAERIS